MPASTDQIQVLRKKYNAALTAYRTSVEAVSRASTRGKKPSPKLLENEAKALRELTEARANLLAAMRGET